MAKPKLALIPATQGSKLYSALPADGVGDFTFSRLSSATRINAQGLIETVELAKSRLNYPLIDGVVNGCPSHLLEPSRTNLITYSEDFTQVDWAGAAVTRELNQIISPDGTLNGAEISSNVAFSQIQQTYTSINNTDYTLSLFAKLPSSNVVGLRLASGSNDVRREFNLSTLSIQSMGGNNQELIDEGIENYGNGWYRIFLTCKADGTSAFLNIYPKNSSDATLQSVFIYGAQLEQGSYPTSYIPTSGSAVTRLEETANGAGDASTFNDSEGVLFVEISGLANDGTNRYISLKNNTTVDIIRIGYITSSNRIVIENYKSGALFNLFNYEVQDVKTNSKIAFKWKDNDFQLYINGLNVLSNTSVTVWGSDVFQSLQFDQHNGSNNFYGKTKQLQYFDSALNDSDLEKLTSWTSFTDMANGQLYSIK